MAPTMIRGTFVAAFLLLLAGILLLVASVSAPVSSHVYLFKIESNTAKAVFGSFGYCLNVLGDNDNCSAHQLGYNITAVAAEATDHTWAGTNLDNLSHAFVLHPVGAAFAFIACLICLVSYYTGFFLAWITTAAAFLASIVVMVFDFIVFAGIRSDINTDTTARASYANGVWLVVAATVALFFAIIAVSADCCCGGDRRTRRRANRLDEYLAQPPKRYSSGAAGASAGDAKDPEARPPSYPGGRASMETAGDAKDAKTGLPSYAGGWGSGETKGSEKYEMSRRGY